MVVTVVSDLLVLLTGVLREEMAPKIAFTKSVKFTYELENMFGQFFT